jgi:hypothetical protein
MCKLSKTILAAGVLVSVQVTFAQESMSSSDLIKKAIATGNVERAIINGETEQYLRKTLKTDKTIYGTAQVVKRLSPTCARTRLEVKIPDLIVTATNPANSNEKKTGPFESTLEGNFCNNG